MGTRFCARHALLRQAVQSAEYHRQSTRERLAIEVDTSLPAQRLARMMGQLKAERGLPNQARTDIDPELI